MSEYVILFRSTEAQANDAMGTPERAQRALETWRAWVQELESKGHLANMGQPLERSGRVVRGKDKVVTDGPYAEAKDMVLGFMVLTAKDLEHATQIASGCPIVIGGGSVEIRPVGKM
jgi:hypothetical protein